MKETLQQTSNLTAIYSATHGASLVLHSIILNAAKLAAIEHNVTTCYGSVTVHKEYRVCRPHSPLGETQHTHNIYTTHTHTHNTHTHTLTHKHTHTLTHKQHNTHTCSQHTIRSLSGAVTSH